MKKSLPDSSNLELEEEKHQVVKTEQENTDTFKQRNKELELLLLSKEQEEFIKEKEKNNVLQKEIQSLKLKILDEDKKFSDKNEEIIALCVENKNLKERIKELETQEAEKEGNEHYIESQKQKLADISINLKVSLFFFYKIDYFS